MSLELTTYRNYTDDFNPTEVESFAGELQEIVTQNTHELRQRNLGGVVVRYGADANREDIAKLIANSQNHSHIDHLVVIENGALSGTASLYRYLELLKQPLPLPPGMFVGPLAKTTQDYPFADTEIKAWVASSDKEVLSEAYQKALFEWRFISLGDTSIEHDGLLLEEVTGVPIAWTTEPTKSDPEVHQSIKDAGFTPIETGWFDDRDISRNLTRRKGWSRKPRSIMYIPEVI